jgi:hypothetical protein
MGDTMSLLPAHYRARAAAIRRLADELRDPWERSRFFDFAIEYEKLAVYAQGRIEDAPASFAECRQRRRQG